jgi:hypothetical protein
MKILLSIIAVAVALAWPTVGEAQSKKARSTTAAQQQDMPRKAKARNQRAAAAKPCAARNWTGCRGWDPDPNVRSEIQRDAGRDDL